MTADERLETLLNRANQTLSDLKRNHTAHERLPALNAVKEYRGMNTKGYVCEWDYEEYILHLTDVIDVMETALVNVTGERDWLKSVLENHLFCETCIGGQGMEPCVNGHLCSTDNPNYRYSGVPEDRRADDGSAV